MGDQTLCQFEDCPLQERYESLNPKLKYCQFHQNWYDQQNGALLWIPSKLDLSQSQFDVIKEVKKTIIQENSQSLKFQSFQSQILQEIIAQQQAMIMSLKDQVIGGSLITEIPFDDFSNAIISQLQEKFKYLDVIEQSKYKVRQFSEKLLNRLSDLEKIELEKTILKQSTSTVANVIKRLKASNQMTKQDILNFLFYPNIEQIIHLLDDELPKILYRIEKIEYFDFNSVQIYKNKELLTLLSKWITKQDQKRLLHLTTLSRNNKWIQYASANAITLLNYSKFDFYGFDLTHIQIKGADLQRAALQKTDFSGSDLRFVNFFQANLDNSRLKNCNLIGAKFQYYNSWRAHKKIAHKVAFSPCGRSVISVPYQGRSVKIWDTQSMTVALTLPKPQSNIHTIQYSQNGNYLALGLENGSILLWDFQTKTYKREFKGHKEFVNCLQFCIAQNLLFSGSADGNLSVWDLQYPKVLKTLQSDSPIMSLRVSNIGYIVFSDMNSRISVRDFNLHQVKVLYTLYTCLNAIGFSPCQKKFAYVDTSQVIKIQNFKENRELSQIHPKIGCLILHLVWTNCGKFIVGLEAFNKVSLFDSVTGETTYQCNLSTQQDITNISLSPFDDQLAISWVNGFLSIVSLNTGCQQFETQHIIPFFLDKIKRSLCGNFFALQLNRQYLRIYNITKSFGQEIKVDEDASIMGFCWSPVNSLFALGTDRGELEVWNVQTMEKVFSYRFNWPIEDLLFSKDQFYLVVAFSISQIRILILQQQMQKSVMLSNNFKAQILAFSASCRYLFWTWNKNSLSIVDLANQNQIWWTYSHQEDIKNVTLLKNNEEVVSASIDGVVRISNYVKKELIKKFKLESKIYGLDLSPSGTYIAFFNQKQLKIYNLERSCQKVSKYKNNIAITAINCSQSQVAISSSNGELKVLTLFRQKGNMYEEMNDIPNDLIIFSNCRDYLIRFRQENIQYFSVKTGEQIQESNTYRNAEFQDQYQEKKLNLNNKRLVWSSPQRQFSLQNCDLRGSLLSPKIYNFIVKFTKASEISTNLDFDPMGLFQTALNYYS